MAKGLNNSQIHCTSAPFPWLIISVLFSCVYIFISVDVVEWGKHEMGEVSCAAAVSRRLKLMFHLSQICIIILTEFSTYGIVNSSKILVCVKLLFKQICLMTALYLAECNQAYTRSSYNWVASHNLTWNKHGGQPGWSVSSAGSFSTQLDNFRKICLWPWFMDRAMCWL